MNDVYTDEATNIQEAVERNLKDADDMVPQQKQVATEASLHKAASASA